MIPKIIHYCWFGRNPLPESAIKCINSWKKFLPDYEIKEWNEDNFDVNIIPYTKEAYEAKKYAFVSDYARFWILYRYGGLYFDTDVEVIKGMDDIVERGPFMGIEVVSPDSQTPPQVAPGLGLGAIAGMPLYKDILSYYDTMHYLDEYGQTSTVTVVAHNTKVLLEKGLKCTNEIQEVAGVTIYPKEFFNPLNDNTGELKITENTRSIHWYSSTWEAKRNPLAKWIVRRIHRYFGNNSLAWLNKLLGR